MHKNQISFDKSWKWTMEDIEKQLKKKLEATKYGNKKT